MRTVSGGQFDWGGRLLKCNGGAQRFPQHGWKSCVDRPGIRELDCETDKLCRCESRSEVSCGKAWNCRRSTDKRYAGDNRLILPKSPHRRKSLAPRCRLVASWGWSRSQGAGCSRVKAVRELGSERRETVRSLSTMGAGSLRGVAPSTIGPERTDLWCISRRANGAAD